MSAQASSPAPNASKLEAWQRGPVEGVPAGLQHVAHSLIQTRDEVTAIADGFPGRLLGVRPAGVASVGFHLRHVTGVLDRLFTYARDEQLTDAQRDALGAERAAGAPDGGDWSGVSAEELAREFSAQVDRALSQLRATPESEITAPRGVGRAKLPSTVLGLLSHAAEHTQRHLGQLLVTARVVRAGDAAQGSAEGD